MHVLVRTSLSMPRDIAEQVGQVVGHACRRPRMWGLATHGEATAFINGINVGTGLFPPAEMREWLLSDGDPKWGGHGGVGWEHRVARVALWGQLDRPDGQPEEFTPADEAAMRDAVLDFALRWLHRPSGPLGTVEQH